MTKENVLIDKSGSTIKFSADGPDIDDLELEEEDIVSSPAAKIEKYLKQINSKILEESPPVNNQIKQKNNPKKEKKNKKNYKRPVKINLYYGSPKKKIHLFGNLEKIHYNKKNDFHNLISVTMLVKTNSVMNFLQITLQNKIFCENIIAYVEKDQKPFIFTSGGKFKRRSAFFRWDVRELVLGNTKGEFTEIKINIS